MAFPPRSEGPLASADDLRNPSAMAQDTSPWQTIGVAAAAAGIPARTAFRWAALGLLPVREIDGQRLVSIEALLQLAGAPRTARAPAAAAATSATSTRPLAPAYATSGTPVSPARAPHALERETLEATLRASMALEKAVLALWARVDHLERAWGLARR